MFDLALRCIEVHRLDLVHADLKSKRLAIWRKGRTAKTWMTLPAETAAALQAWLDQRGAVPGPLFIELDRAHRGTRLGGVSIYRIARALGEAACR